MTGNETSDNKLKQDIQNILLEYVRRYSANQEEFNKLTKEAGQNDCEQQEAISKEIQESLDSDGLGMTLLANQVKNKAGEYPMDGVLLQIEDNIRFYKVEEEIEGNLGGYHIVPIEKSWIKKDWWDENDRLTLADIALSVAVEYLSNFDYNKEEYRHNFSNLIEALEFYLSILSKKVNERQEEMISINENDKNDDFGERLLHILQDLERRCKKY